MTHDVDLLKKMLRTGSMIMGFFILIQVLLSGLICRAFLAHNSKITLSDVLDVYQRKQLIIALYRAVCLVAIYHVSAVVYVGVVFVARVIIFEFVWYFGTGIKIDELVFNAGVALVASIGLGLLLYCLVRCVLAIPITVSERIGVLASIKSSWAMTAPYWRPIALVCILTSASATLVFVGMNELIGYVEWLFESSEDKPKYTWSLFKMSSSYLAILLVSVQAITSATVYCCIRHLELRHLGFGHSSQ